MRLMIVTRTLAAMLSATALAVCSTNCTAAGADPGVHIGGGRHRRSRSCRPSGKARANGRTWTQIATVLGGGGANDLDSLRITEGR